MLNNFKINLKILFLLNKLKFIIYYRIDNI